MKYIFLACGILIGLIVGVFIFGKTVIGNMVILDNPDGDGSLIFLELNDKDSIKKAQNKRYVRVRVVKRKNYN